MECELIRYSMSLLILSFLTFLRKQRRKHRSQTLFSLICLLEQGPQTEAPQARLCESIDKKKGSNLNFVSHQWCWETDPNVSKGILQMRHFSRFSNSFLEMKEMSALIYSKKRTYCDLLKLANHSFFKRELICKILILFLSANYSKPPWLLCPHQK